MDKRTKILAGLFGAVVGYVALANVVYPTWIKPLVHIDERIAERLEEKNRLDAFEVEVLDAKNLYRELVFRIGGFDVGKVETDVRARLNDLVERYKLEDVNVTPSRATEDRKTGVKRMQITLNATGKLDATVHMLREVSEFPHLVRVGNAAINPVNSPGRSQGPPMYNLRIPLELLVLPQQKAVGRIDPEAIRQPERVVRHEDKDYSIIWTRKPFTEPIPLVAQAGRDVNVKVGQPATLSATASGGEPPYAYQWAPSERLDNPAGNRPAVDTTSAWSQVYTVTVTDAAGESATASVRVTVNEPSKPKDDQVAQRPEPPRPPPPDPRWQHRKYLQVRMTLLRSAGDQTVGELMLFNNNSKLTEYYTINDEFDGGKLAYVHPLGGIVHRKDEYFLLPIGHWLDGDIPAGSASPEEYPELLSMVDRLKQNAVVQQQAAGAEEAAALGPADVRQPDRVLPEQAINAPPEAVKQDGGGDASPPATPDRTLDPSEVPGAQPIQQPGAPPRRVPTDRTKRPANTPPGSGGPNLQGRPLDLKLPNGSNNDRGRRGEARLPQGRPPPAEAQPDDPATAEQDKKKPGEVKKNLDEVQTRKRIREFLKRRQNANRDPD